MKKIICYKVDDDCDTPIIYDDLEAAISCVKEMLDGIDTGYEIKISKKLMTKKEFEELPEQ